MNLSEYFNSPEFKELLKPFYDKVRSNPETDSDKKYLDFKLGIQSVTGKALLYYQQFMFKKESSQLIEENLNTFMKETVDKLCGNSTTKNEREVETMIRYYKLNNPDKTWGNDTEFNAEFIGHIVKSASKYHAFNSAFEQGIRANGINPNTKPFDEEEIKKMSELLEKYNCPLSLGCSSRSEGHVYYSTTPSVSHSYGNTSPEWFNQFCSQNFAKKNYDKARQHIISTCGAVNMPTEDAEKVLEFFEKNWNKFAVNTKPKVVMVSQGYDDNMVKKEIEFCEMLNNYDTSFVWGTYNSGGINAETSETIDVTDAEFIDMPEINELLKEFNQEHKKEQEEILSKSENQPLTPTMPTQIQTPTPPPTLPPNDMNENLTGGMER